MQKYKTKDFSLKHTLECGQFFLFEKKEDETYYIINSENIFSIKQKEDTLYYDYISESELIKFFDLELDLPTIKKQLDDKHLIEAFEMYWGLRIIKQDLFECIISFICSSASNIPKITKNLQLISKYFGKEKVIDNKKFYTFPKAGEIDDFEKLKNAKTGYRAKYIYETNNILKENPYMLELIKKSDYENAKKLLMTLPGIGPKVADCICLFSLGHYEAFPLDTWIKQILIKLYNQKQDSTTKQLEDFIEKYFKEKKGIKQQYLFHWARHNLKKSF